MHSVQLLSQYFSFLKESSCMELESMQIIYVILHLWQSPNEIAQCTDISSLNVCKSYNITSIVQKILRTCTGKQTIEGVPV